MSHDLGLGSACFTHLTWLTEVPRRPEAVEIYMSTQTPLITGIIGWDLMYMSV
jgi:hypothetical protein